MRVRHLAWMLLLPSLIPDAPAGCGAAPAAAPPPDGIVDRIEGRVAVVDTDGGTVEVPAAGLAEGDVMVGGRVDPEARRRLLEGLAARRARLGAGDRPGEDLDL